MEQQSRRGLLKNAAKAAVAVSGGAMLAQTAKAQGTAPSREKKAYPPKTQADKIPVTSSKKPLFSSSVSYNGMLFLAGIGAHFKGTIQEHTKHVLSELEKNLINAGSSMEKVLRVNVYLNDLKDYDAMNSVYATSNWGSVPPVRTTIAAAGGIPGNSLVEIDCIAFI